MGKTGRKTAGGRTVWMDAERCGNNRSTVEVSNDFSLTTDDNCTSHATLHSSSSCADPGDEAWSSLA